MDILFKRKFKKESYFQEMKSLVKIAIDKLKSEKSDFEIYTASIWTDPNSASSSISFESKSNSDLKVQKSNEWNKKYYEQYIEEGNVEQAKLFETTVTRNCNPADFALRDFVEINNKSFRKNWETKSDGKCWDEIEPLLKEIGEYAFNQIKDLKIHQEFEMSINGRLDWYEFTWKNY